MAAKAFVLVTTSVGQTKSVLTHLKKLDGIKSVDAVMGPYDIIAVVEGESVDLSLIHIWTLPTIYSV